MGFGNPQAPSEATAFSTGPTLVPPCPSYAPLLPLSYFSLKGEATVSGLFLKLKQTPMGGNGFSYMCWHPGPPRKACPYSEMGLYFEKFLKSPSERPLVGHRVMVLSATHWFCDLMLKIKPFTKKGGHILTPSLAASLSTGSWLFYWGISWGCEQASEILKTASLK